MCRKGESLSFIPPSSKPLLPLPRRVRHSQNFHCISSHSIGNDVRRFGIDQLPRPRNSRRPAHRWILIQQIHGPQNLLHHAPCRRWIIHCNVSRFCIQVGERARSHLTHTASPLLRQSLYFVLACKLPSRCLPEPLVNLFNLPAIQRNVLPDRFRRQERPRSPRRRREFVQLASQPPTQPQRKDFLARHRCLLTTSAYIVFLSSVLGNPGCFLLALLKTQSHSSKPVLPPFHFCSVPSVCSAASALILSFLLLTSPISFESTMQSIRN